MIEKDTVLCNISVEDGYETGNRIAPNYITHIVFTDHPAPSDVDVQDVSNMRDGGVVAWEEGDTMYISTQRAGVKVTAPENCACLFLALENLEIFDGTMLDVSQVRYMCFFFYGCKSLTEIIGLQNWDTSHVTDMDGMFVECYALQGVDSLANWDVSNVQTMSWMFHGCSHLENIDDLATWDVSHVENMALLFDGCKSLKNVDGLLGWNVRNVTDMCDMFGGCPNLSTKPSWYHND
jgi:surface protein